MITRPLVSIALGLALAASACDTGGLLVVDRPTSQVSQNEPTPIPVTEIVASGTLVSNGEYRLFYTMGQPTPQGAVGSTTHGLKGGIAGSAH